MLFLNICDKYHTKQKITKKGVEIKPIINCELNSRCQVDLVDMQASKDVNSN